MPHDWLEVASPARSRGSRTGAAPRNRRPGEGILSARGPNRSGFMRRPALHLCDAPGRAQPGIRPLCDMRGLGGRDLAARNGRQHGGQHLPKILERPQRRQVDPETRRRADGCERRRQELLGEGPQQLRLAVYEIRQRLRSAAEPQDRARAAWDWECRAAGRADCRSFPSQTARARRAREAERDQAQVIEIPGIEAWNTGDYRTRQADRQRFPASAVLQGKRTEHVGS